MGKKVSEERREAALERAMENNLKEGPLLLLHLTPHTPPAARRPREKKPETTPDHSPPTLPTLLPPQQRTSPDSRQGYLFPAERPNDA